jgi:delta 1-pyrroline-5-carboxylate dehydrogenase
MDAATAHAQLGKAASRFIAGKHQLLIDGKWSDAKSGKGVDDFDPATGQVIASVPEADAADVDEAVRAARRAFESGPWPKASPADRCKLLWKLADLLGGAVALAASKALSSYEARLQGSRILPTALVSRLRQGDESFIYQLKRGRGQTC